MAVLKDLQTHARKSGAPATYAIIAALVGFFLLAWLTQDQAVRALAFRPDAVLERPWSLLTYFLASGGGNLIGVAFASLWMYWIGTTVERELGTGRFLAFFAAMTLIPVLLIWLGLAMMNAVTMLNDPWLPIAGVTVAWATRHPLSTVLLAFVIPVQARVVGWLAAALVFFGYGYSLRAPLMGAFAAAHLGLAWAHASGRLKFLQWGRGVSRDEQKQMKWERERDQRYFDEVRRREQDREERERLRKLFESSMKDDEPER